ncbi:MAG: hypothetical protein PHR21_02075 [Oscillospiraceae bacterium]|nr:hypothetical protein [Oscillospiraceae bacterium]MDD4368218.1 hypothetical protein [Oscillospiraceae bacterium]
MKPKTHVHILGASGSGTTTIAKSVCDLLGYKHFDSDQYFWLPTSNPFTVERPQDECIALLRRDLTRSPEWILSGSLAGWGDTFIASFDLVVFVYVPQPIRVERLRKRERERYGDQILPGGARYEDSRKFLDWAAAYDAGTKNGRSKLKHEIWLSKMDCPVVKIINDDLAASVKAVWDAIQK